MTCPLPFSPGRRRLATHDPARQRPPAPARVTRGMVDMAEGRIKTPPLRTFPLAKLGEAEAVMEARDFFGKIVMIV